MKSNRKLLWLKQKTCHAIQPKLDGMHLVVQSEHFKIKVFDIACNI